MSTQNSQLDLDGSKNLSLNYNYSDTYDGADCDDPNVGNGECIDDSMVRVPRHALSTILSFKNNKNLTHDFLLNYSGEVRDYGNTNNGFKDVILDDHIIFGYNTVSYTHLTLPTNREV